MVTHNQFLKALEVITEYGRQIKMIYPKMPKNIDYGSITKITKDTLLKDADISLRLLNALQHLDLDKKPVSCLQQYSLQELDYFRNIGKKH